MKELMTNDLDDVFYDENEFAIEIEHTNEEKMALEKFVVIFDEKTEIILDNSSEYGDSIAYVPSFLVQVKKAGNIDSRSTFLIDRTKYALSTKEKENIDEYRVYLEIA